MILSKSCEYAIRAVVYLGYRSKAGNKTGIPEVADAIGSPLHFTGKILQTLAKKGVISSFKGPNGGFYLEKLDATFLVDIVSAIDGNDIFTSCIMGLKSCSDTRPCPLHDRIKPVRQQLHSEFASKSIKEMVEAFEKKSYFLK